MFDKHPPNLLNTRVDHACLVPTNLFLHQTKAEGKIRRRPSHTSAPSSIAILLRLLLPFSLSASPAVVLLSSFFSRIQKCCSILPLPFDPIYRTRGTITLSQHELILLSGCLFFHNDLPGSFCCCIILVAETDRPKQQLPSIKLSLPIQPAQILPEHHEHSIRSLASSFLKALLIVHSYYIHFWNP